MSTLLCGGQARNLNAPADYCEIERPIKFNFQQAMNIAGTRNSILTTDTVDDTYVKGMIQTGDKTNASQDDDPSKRWFPTTELQEVEDVRDEDISEEIDGFSYRVTDGVRNVSFKILKATPELVKAYKSRQTLSNDAFYAWTTKSQIVGNGSSGELRPVRIQPGTFKVMYEKATKTTFSKLMVSFALADSERDEDIAFLSPGDGVVADNLRIEDYSGLIDVTLAVDSAVTVTGTTATIDASYIYGSLAKKGAFRGLLAGDLTLDGSAVTSVTETATLGKYEIVFPTLTSGDYVLEMFKESFYSTPITVTIP